MSLIGVRFTFNFFCNINQPGLAFIAFLIKNIGEDGVTLSGGQRQRLSIARAIAKDSPILILDEATSALDSATEKLVQSAITEMQKGRTTIIIAHRLSTIQNADRIIVLKEGEIIEQGSHKELINASGEYAKLNQQQF